jgi:hypothetical protein
MLTKYTLPTCLAALRGLKPLEPGRVVPAEVLQKAVDQLVTVLRPEAAAPFVAEKDRLLADVVDRQR